MGSLRVASGLVLSVLLGLSLVACKKEEAGGSGGKGGATSAEAGGSSDLDLIPIDSELVLGINLAQVQKSAMFRDLVLPKLTQDAESQAKLQMFKDKCGIDPMTAISSITVGVAKLGESEPNAIVVLHGLEKGKALSCIDKMKDEMEKDKDVTVTRDGDVVVMKGNEPGETVAISFVNDSTAVATIGAKGTKEGVLEVAKAKSGLSTSKEFVDMHGRIKTSDTLWFLVNGSAEAIASQLKRLDYNAKAIFGSVNVSDGLAIDLRVRLDSEDKAKGLAEIIKSQGQMAASMVDKFDVSADGSDVKATVSASQEKLKSIAGMFGPMLGGGMR